VFEGRAREILISKRARELPILATSTVHESNQAYSSP
jgi:hypothetical protein